ncbi:hypothetical protein HBH98_231370 [Parastagonospora nodorum]|nr:hypothetical protein HBH53_235020 [Parastagonospora nodorum]KAH3957215.1 hypothetical protein HBH51_228390 [Parastagonospora nodorum]KAH4043167.1 hypothetical protein HBH49_237070 [Parastagonospora nodorum]KAH4056768.1 hypothetical protein HBH50_240080 [Parastagonospora nodorum]KAH4077813.1 hypothetical protein HBH48_237740 [Parastagonospora nodorum]
MPQTTVAQSLHPDWRYLPFSQAQQVIDAHYTQCVSGGCGMGLHICLLIIKSMPHIAKDLEMEKLVAKHPAMGADMYLAARGNDGKLW